MILAPTESGTEKRADVSALKLKELAKIFPYTSTEAFRFYHFDLNFNKIAFWDMQVQVIFQGHNAKDVHTNSSLSWSM